MSSLGNGEKIPAITGLTLDFTNQMLGMNASNYRAGMHFLDLGAGASSVTAELANMHGVNAIALDVGYASLHELLERNLDEIVETRSSFRPGYDITADIYTAARAKFIEDIAAHPERYVAADTRHLPFHDKTFDLVQSCMMLDLEHAADMAFATQVTLEAVRVLRRGGKLVVGPGHAVSGKRWEAHQNIYNALQSATGKKDKLVKRNVGGSAQIIHFQKG